MMHQFLRDAEMTVDGSDDLYRAVRAAFVARGTSLNAWCIANGVNRQTVEKALKGQRFSRRAAALRKNFVRDLFSEGGGQ